MIRILAAMALPLAVSSQAAPPAQVPLFEGTGAHTRRVTTSSKAAQRYFDQGLSFLYAFNHDEAIRSFTEAARLDPKCAMAFWGIAVANGPHINNPAVSPHRDKAALEAAGRARTLAGSKDGVERALIEALSERHRPGAPADRKPLDTAYANAMKEVWRRFPRDADVGALYAEAMMDLRPWDLWTPDGRPQPGTEEVIATLESVMAIQPDHPLALHLYIHAVEMSPNPGQADAAADRLRDLVPGMGHLVHMPSHIDVRRGRWEKAIEANLKARQADRRYREKSPQQDFYRMYMAHNHHMQAYAAMMVGRSSEAIASMEEMVAGMPESWRKESSAIADGFLAMPLEVRIRFGRWDEILAAPDLPADFPLARALRLYARGIAHASRGDAGKARAEQAAFLKAKSAVPAEAFFGNNSAAALLEVATHLLEGEILYREGKPDEAFATLRQGVAAEDVLRYDEPPGWIHPVRHALGAVLIQSGRAAEAEAVYREDLAKLPNNGWALFGLARGLRMQGKNDEAARADEEFARAWEKADVRIGSSCFCQPGDAAAAGEATASGGGYEAEIEAWRRRREDRLKSDTGWLTVAGLTWLEEGDNAFGSGPGSRVALPAGAPDQAGVFTLLAGKTTVRLEPGVEGTVSGRPVPREGAAMQSDAQGDPDLLVLGRFTMFVIERNGRLAIRLRDPESVMRREFTGLKWYPIKPEWRIEARWEPYSPAKKVQVPNILGFVEESECPGAAVFTHEGRSVRLEPILEAGAEELFFIFKDGTSGKGTYPAGRFLYAPLPEGGKVVLDFNKAYTPPCAFTPYATCPLPPEGNRLTARIEAGEFDYGKH